MAHGRRDRILVVDDDVSIRDLLEETLTAEGFDVSTASSADEALRSAAAESPDVILLDMRMPDDGPRFQAELSRRSLRAPIIAMSASDRADVRAQELGVHFIAKPFMLDSMVATVRSVVDKLRQPT